MSNAQTTEQLICTAALRCVKRFGFNKTNISEIAREAGITRPTLYKYFENKQAVLFQAIDTEAFIFAANVVEHAQTFKTLEERIIETIVYVVQELPKHPYLSLIIQDDVAKEFRDRAFSDEATEIFSQMTSGPLVELEPKLENNSIEISEIMSRFAISLILFPGKYSQDTQGLRSLIKRRVLPGLLSEL